MNTTAEAGLLHAIIDERADDGLRLFLADLLEERGDPRGTFIRTQVELAKAPACLGLRRAGHQRPCRLCQPFEALRRRERELETNIAGLGQPIPGYISALSLEGEHVLFDMRGKEVGRFVFRRGFVAEITCTLEGWCGTECPNCGNGRWIATARCPRCHGAGRVNAHGPALVQHCPLECVTLTDKKPHCHTSPGHVFFRYYIGDEGVDELPEDLWHLMHDGRSDWHQPTAEALNVQLSSALLAWARAQPVPALA
jgi:uncharacterized protein (TIGR02996 family)